MSANDGLNRESRSAGKLRYGWNEALDIPSTLGLASHRNLDSMVALLATIDSGQDVVSMPSLIPRLKHDQHWYNVVDQTVAIEMTTFRGLITDGFFPVSRRSGYATHS